MGRGAAVLVCPRCAKPHESEERFCRRCGLPLVLDGPQPSVSERRGRARKIKPQLSEGRLVRVASARNQPEGEFIQGLLLEEGVPSLLRRSAGFDVPDFLAAGPRDVLVPESGAETAREVLLEAEVISPPSSTSDRVPAGRLMAWLLVALAAGALVIVLLYLTGR